MAKIEGAELVALIFEGLSATPQRLPSGHKEQLARDAISGQLIASTTSIETQALDRTLAPLRPLILESAIEKLLRCQIISVPAPICNAKATIRNGKPLIIIFDGLLDFVVAAMEMNHAILGLPSQLDLSFPQPEFSTVSARSWATMIFVGLTSRFLTHGESLPDFRSIISTPTIKRDIEYCFLGAVWWILLHELGHIELGHTRLLDGQSRLTMSEGLVVHEEISAFQYQEFEADAFVFNCLTDDGKKLFYGWTSSVLGSMMMIESLFASPKGTHPLSINRLTRAHELSRSIDEIAIELKIREQLASQGKSHLNLRATSEAIKLTGGRFLLEQWTREELLRNLHGLMSLFLDSGVDIKPLLHGTTKGWRALFA